MIKIEFQCYYLLKTNRALVIITNFEIAINFHVTILKSFLTILNCILKTFSSIKVHL